MAYTAGKLVLHDLGGGKRRFIYDAGADSMATVAAAGYFNNVDDAIKIVSGDIIFAMCVDGDCWLKYSSEVAASASSSAGAVTTTMALPSAIYRGVVGSASANLSVGINEIGTGTASAFGSPTPYAGAVLTVTQIGTATGGRTVAVSSSGVTLGNSLATVTLNGQGQSFTLLGVSASRWVILDNSGVTFS